VVFPINQDNFRKATDILYHLIFEYVKNKENSFIVIVMYEHKGTKYNRRCFSELWRM